MRTTNDGPPLLWLSAGKHSCGSLDCYIGGDANDLNPRDAWKHSIS